MMKVERVPLIVHLALAYGVAVFQSLPIVTSTSLSNIEEEVSVVELPKLKQEALLVLQNKCNVCHKKQNPFKVFKENNMSRLAPKIYEQVFIKKRMPKPGQSLSDNEKSTLKEWLKTEKIN